MLFIINLVVISKVFAGNKYYTEVTMTNDLIKFDDIKNGIIKIRDRAESGIKRITADFLVAHFFEDIEAMRKRGYRYEEIIDELNIMLVETVPDKTERNKLFAIKSGTLKVYMSRKRKEIIESVKNAVNEKLPRERKVRKSESVTAKQTVATNDVKVESISYSSNTGNVPTGRARATDLDRKI